MSHPVSATAADVRSLRGRSSKTTQPICHKAQALRLLGKSAVGTLVRLIGKSCAFCSICTLAFTANATQCLRCRLALLPLMQDDQGSASKLHKPVFAIVDLVFTFTANTAQCLSHLTLLHLPALTQPTPHSSVMPRHSTSHSPALKSMEAWTKPAQGPQCVIHDAPRNTSRDFSVISPDHASMPAQRPQCFINKI